MIFGGLYCSIRWGRYYHVLRLSDFISFASFLDNLANISTFGLFSFLFPPKKSHDDLERTKYLSFYFGKIIVEAFIILAVSILLAYMCMSIFISVSPK